MDLLASLKAEGLHEFANVWICFPSFQVSQLTCNYVAWKHICFLGVDWPRGGVYSYSFFLSSCGSLRRWRSLSLDLDTKSIISWLRDEVHVSENLRSEYHRGDWSDFLNSNWTFPGKSESQFSMISVQSDLSVGFWLFSHQNIFSFVLLGPRMTWTFP